MRIEEFRDLGILKFAIPECFNPLRERGLNFGNSSIGTETSQTKSEKEASKPPYQNYGEILNQKSKGSH